MQESISSLLLAYGAATRKPDPFTLLLLRLYLQLQIIKQEHD